MPRNSYKLPPPSKRCVCLLACNYYMLRCDSCHRGVHFTCLKLSDPVADRPNVFVCMFCKNNGIEETRVAEIRAAEGRPCKCSARPTRAQERIGKTQAGLCRPRFLQGYPKKFRLENSFRAQNLASAYQNMQNFGSAAAVRFAKADKSS